MTVLKCKMCGGMLETSEGDSVTVCEYCGTKQTIPSQDNEKKLSLFARAERLRRSNEFNKAAGIYESIISEFPEEAEAYWGLVLCKYGIEYVDDPNSGKKIPTCHRSSFDSVLDDNDFEQACENADPIAKKLYREEAKAIENLRIEIFEISGKEEPYDIFICYKETDDIGERTVDSVMAQEVYDVLTEKGYRVFFSRISLEDKQGMRYEPYIFAALNSARVMLVFGTDYEYFNAVWVKNEWQRFLSLIASGQKKTLIPCYKDIDAYDMPKEFAHLQAQDMGKVGAVQDLLRGIDKLFASVQKETVKQSFVSPSGVGAESLVKRGNLFLEESNWDKAAEYFGKALDIDPENGYAYIGQFCVNMHYHRLSEALEDSHWYEQNLNDNTNYARALRFGDAKLQSELEHIEIVIKENGKEYRRQKVSVLKEKRDKLNSLAGIIALEGYEDMVGLCLDGTVVAVGYDTNGECDVSGWRDIVAVACGTHHTVGLRSDGTVVAVGFDMDGRCDVSGWRDIVAVACGDCHTVGLRSDGTVVAVGDDTFGECDVSGWRDIVAVACGSCHTVGLRSDGTVVAVNTHIMGLRSDGTWVAVNTHTEDLYFDEIEIVAGANAHGECDVSGWRDIIAVACGTHHTVGLRSDGTVVAVGDTYGQRNISKWRDIVAIACGGNHTVGLQSDGTVVYTDRNNSIGRVIKDWKLFENIDTLEQERAEAKAYRERAEVERKEEAERKRKEEAERKRKEEAERKRKEEAERKRKEEECRPLEMERANIQTELASLKGLFSGRRRKKLEERIFAIDMEIKMKKLK